MSSSTREYPFYIKATTVMVGLTALVYALFVMQDILAPIAFSLVIAILLNPMVNFMERKGFNRVVAIFIALLIAIIIIGGIIFFISAQLVNFSDSLPEFKSKFNELFLSFQQWLSNTMNITLTKQQELISKLGESSQKFAGGAIGGAFGILGFIILVPFYVFLLLFYKSLLINFLHEVFSKDNTSKVSDVLTETKSSIQSYMVGLLLEAMVVAVLNSIALMILGLEYAILIGVIGALLNMLPYIGGIIAIALPVLLALVTKDGITIPLAIIGAYTLIQFIDNNFLVPFLVSSRVKINALISVIVVLMGGAVWGISGMFLSIPFVAILKIIFDRVPELKPWGKLLGDEIPTRHKGQIWNRNRNTKKNSLAEEIVEKAGEE